jgi:hypothetical protein
VTQEAVLLLRGLGVPSGTITLLSSIIEFTRTCFNSDDCRRLRRNGCIAMNTNTSRTSAPCVHVFSASSSNLLEYLPRMQRPIYSSTYFVCNVRKRKLWWPYPGIPSTLQPVFSHGSGRLSACNVAAGLFIWPKIVPLRWRRFQSRRTWEAGRLGPPAVVWFRVGVVLLIGGFREGFSTRPRPLRDGPSQMSPGWSAGVAGARYR